MNDIKRVLIFFSAKIVVLLTGLQILVAAYYQRTDELEKGKKGSFLTTS